MRRHEGIAASGEIEAAALQFVRKISGYRKPSKANAEAFEDAVREVEEVSEKLLGRLRVHSRVLGRDVG